jgi:hypothetical protein
MTQLVNRQGAQSINFTNWLITNTYESGDAVVRDNNVYIANGNIPANTAFATGTTGATWQVAIKGYNPDLNPPLLIASSGTGYGRCHAWGNKILRAGTGDDNDMGNMYAGGMTQSDCTIEFTCLDELPESWVKIQDMRSNFYGLGSNGILYVAGSNNYGQLGLGEDVPVQYQIIQQQHPALYGPGITVLNFWATDVLINNWAFTAQCWVQVNDNGVIRLYSFGDNGWGCIGNYSLSDVQYLPYEHGQMTDKVIKNMAINFFRNSDGARGGLTVIITEDGEVWNCGGNNTDGELGIGYNTSNTPVLTRAMFNATTYVTGAVDGCISWRAGDGIATHILLADGTVYSSGKNDYGRLGRGNIDGTNIPFYQQVLTAPNTPLTGIVKLKTSVNGLVAMNSEGLVYTTGRNYDGWWGNGQASFANGTGYAAMKQGGVKDFWLNANGTGWSAAWWLMKDGTFWASGHNVFKQMGSIDTADTLNSTIRRVLLPTGEYPVQFKWMGGVYESQMIGAGVLMVSNKNKLYMWGKPYVSASSVKNVDEPRYPHCIVDFYSPQDI